MKLMRFSGILIAALLAFAAASAAQDTGPVYSANVGSPTKSGTDDIDIRYKDTDNVNHHIRTEVDIDEDDTEQEKAEKIAEAINSATDEGGQPQTQVKAVAIGDTVQVVGQDGNEVASGRVKSKSGQGTVRWRKISEGGDSDSTDSTDNATSASLRAAASPAPAPLPVPPTGTIQFTGSISGVDNYGNPAIARAGTGLGATVRNTADFATIDELVQALVADLNALGIAASQSAPDTIYISLSPADGLEVVFGSTDVTLPVTGTLNGG